MSEKTDGCRLCPRLCDVNRIDRKGYCGMPDSLVAARAALHMWEEPCISGERGSGAVFFSGCTLRCIFCQNYDIAAGKTGKEITDDRLSEIFLELQEKKANNINLVTPTHYVHKIIPAIRKAKDNGLKIPVVYNTSGYELVDTLKRLEGLVDVYLPDFKYVDGNISREYSSAADYYEYATKALGEMVRQAPISFFDKQDDLVKSGYVEDGIMKSGVIVRHLVLPGTIGDSKDVIQYLYSTYGDSIFISIMSQYTPLTRMNSHSLLGRRTSKREYDAVVDYAIDLGVTNAFIQEGDVAKESFIPQFDGEGI